MPPIIFEEFREYNSINENPSKYSCNLTTFHHLMQNSTLPINHINIISDNNKTIITDAGVACHFPKNVNEYRDFSKSSLKLQASINQLLTKLYESTCHNEDHISPNKLCQNHKIT